MNLKFFVFENKHNVLILKYKNKKIFQSLIIFLISAVTFGFLIFRAINDNETFSAIVISFFLLFTSNGLIGDLIFRVKVSKHEIIIRDSFIRLLFPKKVFIKSIEKFGFSYVPTSIWALGPILTFLLGDFRRNHNIIKIQTKNFKSINILALTGEDEGPEQKEVLDLIDYFNNWLKDK